MESRLDHQRGRSVTADTSGTGDCRSSRSVDANGADLAGTDPSEAGPIETVELFELHTEPHWVSVVLYYLIENDRVSVPALQREIDGISADGIVSILRFLEARGIVHSRRSPGPDDGFVYELVDRWPNDGAITPLSALDS